MGYGLVATVDAPYLQVLEKVRMSLVEQEFTILTETDVSQLLHDHLGVATPPQTALGVCALPALRALLEVEPSVGLLVPIPVVVRAHEVGVTIVEAANPRLLVATTGHPGLESVAADVSARMAVAFNALTSRPAVDRHRSPRAISGVVAVEAKPSAATIVRI